MQTKYKGKYRERVERQFKIVKPEATREEIEQVRGPAAARAVARRGRPLTHTAHPPAPRPSPQVLEGGSQQEVFTQQILQQPGHAAAKNALADIQERNRDIHRLEASIAELRQLFLDMAVLVESQGELLDQIEYTVSQSVNYTSKAVEELRSAGKYQRSYRKKVCCMIVIMLALLIIIVVPVLESRRGDV